MNYRDRRNGKKTYKTQRSGALIFSLLSGHGAGMFLCVITPMQLFSRVTPQFLGLLMIAAAGLAVLFGWGAVHAYNSLHFDGEDNKYEADEAYKESVKTALRGFAIVVAAMAIGGLSMFSMEFRAFAFDQSRSVESPESTSTPALVPQETAPEPPPS
jgi:hypothetical protein